LGDTRCVWWSSNLRAEEVEPTLALFQTLVRQMGDYFVPKLLTIEAIIFVVAWILLASGFFSWAFG
jgi:hypothetical protein